MAPAAPGSRNCEVHKASERDYAKGHYADQVAKGLCTACSEPVVPGRTRCPRHLKYRRARHLTERYGLTEAAFEEMGRAQEHRCVICRRKEKLVVDHDHETGKIRALLCDPCNRGIASLETGKAFLFFRENPDILTAAAAYLLTHRT